MAREIKPLILLAGYSAYPRAINFARLREIADGVGGSAHGGHGAFRGTGGGRRIYRRQQSRAARPRGHDDDAQDAARSARRSGAVHQGVCRSCRQRLPAGHRWAALEHVIAAKAIALTEANHCQRSRTTRAGSWRIPRPLSAEPDRGGLDGRDRVARTTTSCLSTFGPSDLRDARPKAVCASAALR